MPSSPSTRDRIELQAAGENLNTWGAPKLNAALQRLEEAKDGRLAKVLTGNYTLVATNYVADEARMAFLDFSGTPPSPCTVTIPAVEKTYLVRNATAGVLIITTGSGTTVTLQAATSATVATDGTNVRVIGVDADDLANTLATAKFYTDSVATGAGNLPGSVGEADYVLMTQNVGAGGGSPQFFSPSAGLAKLGGGSLAGTNAWLGANTFTTQALNDTSTKASTTAFVQAAAMDRGWIAGLTLSAVGSSATFGIAPGQASDSTTIARLNLASAYTKTTSAWALGTAAGALDTGSIANTTWYHAYLIQRPDTGVVDVLVSLSATAPTLPTNYTLFRRIGSLLTDGSAKWVAFTQNGDDFTWTTAVSGATGTLAVATPSLVTLTGAPVGVKVKLHLSANITLASGGQNYIAVSSPDTGGQAASILNAVAVANGATAGESGQTDVWSNTSAQVYVAVTAQVSTTYTIGIMGWTDRRGRDA